jgi:L-alanine-DL-glutamate epimerase-like enolase superfamily enzyme
MSRIVSVRTRVVCLPLHTTFTTALRSTDTTDAVLVEVEDSDGVGGLGVAPVVPVVTGEDEPGIRAALSGPLRDAVLGAGTDDLSDLLARVTAVPGHASARAGVDVALHDLAARRAGVPLAVFIRGCAGEVPTGVPTDVTVAAGDAARLATAARDRVADGFTALKLKAGTDAATDVARVRAVRSAVGPSVVIRLDANQGWTPDQAIRVIRALEDAGAGVELVEQPVRATDLDGLARVTAAVATPVMADEAVFTLADLNAVIERGAATLVNVKLAKAGGLAPARDQLLLAGAHGIGTMVGSMMETGIGVAAAGSLVAAVGTTLVGDLDAAWWLAEGTAPVSYDAGVLRLADSPGLGSVR